MMKHLVGGTILREKEVGNEIAWLNITNIFESQGFSKEKILERQIEIEKVCGLYKFDRFYNLNIPTMTLSSLNFEKLISDISFVFQEFKPNRIFVSNRSDAHSDHRWLFSAVAACSKVFRYPFIEQVFMYECLSETEFAPQLSENLFIPNYFIDISDFLDKKIQIMKIYKSELDIHPFPRSIENIKALATYRGASCGVKYAEAFHLVKFIEK